MASSKAGKLAALPHKPTNAAEGLAIGGALLCLVHCLFLPLLLAWLPALSEAWNPGVDLHLWLVLLVGPLSAWLLVSAVRQHKMAILSAGFAGLGLLILALLLPLTPLQETLMSVAGSLALAGAHIANWVLRHRIQHVSG